MAYGDDSFEMLGDDESLFAPSPMDAQKLLAAQVRRNPALATPSNGVQLPKAATAAPAGEDYTVGPAPGTAPYTLMQLVARMNKPPDMSQYVQHARERNDNSNRKLVMALALQAKGGEAFAPFGQALGQQALKESGDYEIPGGYGVVSPQGTVALNQAKLDEGEDARLTRIYAIQDASERAREIARYRADALKAQHDATAAAKADREAGSRNLANSRLEDQMSKMYAAQTKDYRVELDATQKVAQLAPTMLGRRPNAIEQQTLMVLLNKFLDPTSVVREGEFDRVARAQGYIDRAGNLLNYISRGEPLSNKLIGEIVGMSQFYEKAARSKLQQIGDETHRKAVARGLDPSFVIIDPYYTPREQREAAGAARPGGRGTADAPIRVVPRAPAAAAPSNVIESNY